MSRNYDWEQGLYDGRHGYERTSSEDDYCRGHNAGIRREIEADQERRNRSMLEEQQQFEEDMRKAQESQPEVVPCYKCKNQMYAEHWQNSPSENVCEECEDEFPF